MSLPLAGRRIALAEGRQLEELAELLAREGAEPVRCPMVSILDAPDPAPVRVWLADLTAGRFGWVIFLTGEGVRRLLAQAERDATRDEVVTALGGVKLVARGPKPVKELKALGLTPHAVASPATTPGVITALKAEQLNGATVGVQLYAPDKLELVDFLRGAGGAVETVLPYVYAPAADADQVAALIGRLAAGELAAIIFTSSPQVDRLFEVAAERGTEAQLRAGLDRTVVAAVGPVMADTLEAYRVRVDVCPQQGFVMKNLVQQLKRYLTGG
ncbi:MAG: uroporphyrinogen-III synthase [Gemmataceae bacterium]